MTSASILASPGASAIFKGGLQVRQHPPEYHFLSSYSFRAPFAALFFFQMFTFLSRPFSHTISHRSLKLNLSQLYTLESRIAYAGWTEENLKDYTGPTPEIVKGIAENVRPKLDTTYTICESGTAGPTGGDTRNRTP